MNHTTQEKIESTRFWFSGFAIAIYLVLFKLLFHFSTTGRYGYFRDELYYLACADHLGWGYVDHPPFSIALLALIRWGLGDSLFAIRFVPVLALGLTILFVTMITRELGGGRFAQALAALVTLLSPIYLGLSTFYSMNALDVFLTAFSLFLLLRIINSGSSKLWIAFGLISGIGLLNKFNIGIFGAALIIGLLMVHRRTFLDIWLYIGGAIAALLSLPHIIWQWHYNFPFIEFISNAKSFKMTAMSLTEFLGSQVLLVGPAALPLCLGGLVFLLFSKSMSQYRILGFIFIIMTAIIFILKGKSYYLSPSYAILFAGGAVAIERLPGKLVQKVLKPAYLVFLIVVGLVQLPMVVPLLVPESYGRYASAIGIAPPQDEKHAVGTLPQHLADRFGWENMVSTVAGVYNGLTEEDKIRCSLLAKNYGEAGAIDFFGDSHGLPNAISLHNSYWLWGPGDATGEIVIAIGFPKEELHPIFETIEERARVNSPYAMPYENDLPVYLCRKIKVPIDMLWPEHRLFI